MDKIVAEIQSSPGTLSVEAITREHPLANKGTTDDEVVAYATHERRILVTTEGRLDEKKFTVCTHSGNIVIGAGKRYEFERAKLFTRFMQSGHRSAAKHAVTKLRFGRECIRIERSSEGDIVRTTFQI